MIITLGQARKLLSRFAGKAGKCEDSEDTRLFVMEVVQRLLHKGANGNLRKWCFCTQNGCVTLPEDVDTVLKAKVDGLSERVWSKWYEWYDVNEGDDCHSWPAGVSEENNKFFTIYDLPPGGAHIVAVPLIAEDCKAHFVIQGLDDLGRTVYVEHNGEKMAGEFLSIDKAESKRTKTRFSKILGIQKTVTNHYVRLYWYKPETGEQGLLGEYKPGETFPSYRRVRVGGCRDNVCNKVWIFGRIKEPDYQFDNEILPITNLSALKKMGQAIQNEDQQKITEADFASKKAEELLQDENQYKRTGDEGFDFIQAWSPGKIDNLD